MKKIYIAICLFFLLIAGGISYYDEHCRNWVPQADGSQKTTGLIFDQQRFPDGSLLTIWPYNSSYHIVYPNGTTDDYDLTADGRKIFTAHNGKVIHTPHWED